MIVVRIALWRAAHDVEVRVRGALGGADPDPEVRRQHDARLAFQCAIEQRGGTPDQAPVFHRPTGHRDDVAGDILVLDIAVVRDRQILEVRGALAGDIHHDRILARSTALPAPQARPDRPWQAGTTTVSFCRGLSEGATSVSGVPVDRASSVRTSVMASLR
jgi:hypothetical protein